MNTKKLEQILEQPLAYNKPAKDAFHSEAKRVLKTLADKLGLKAGEYDLRSNKGGIGVGGEVTLHSDTLYVQIYKSMFSKSDVMYRRCNGRKDYTGEANHFAEVARMFEESFIRQLKALMT